MRIRAGTNRSLRKGVYDDIEHRMVAISMLFVQYVS